MEGGDDRDGSAANIRGKDYVSSLGFSWYDHHDHFPDAVDKPEGTSSNDEVDDSTVILIQQLKPAGFTFDSVPRVDEVDLGYDDLS